MAGRKRRGKSTDTDIKAKIALNAVLENPGKTKQEIADQLGIDRNTVTARLNRALNDDNIKDYIQRSIDLNGLMLSKCDRGLNRILDAGDEKHFPTQLRAIEGVYKSFGVWKNEPIIQVNHFTPIVFKVGSEVMTLDVGTPRETGKSSS